MARYEIERAAGCCGVTGDVFKEGEEFHTVLFEEGDSFRRADYCIEHWSGPPEGAFCDFRSRVPVREKRKKLLVDNELLENLFFRLEEETEPKRIQFRFVLALILMRKRLLKYERSIMRDGLELWEMVLVRDKSPHMVTNPHLTDEQIEGVSEQITSIMHGDMGEWASPGEQQGGEQPPTESDEADESGS